VYTPEGRVNLIEYCKQAGFDPVIRMIEIAEDDKHSPSLRLSACREIAKYVHPILGRMNVEHSGKIEGDLSDKQLGELRDLADSLRSGRTAHPDRGDPGTPRH
jgi:hypothetical protein